LLHKAKHISTFTEVSGFVRVYEIPFLSDEPIGNPADFLDAVETALLKHLNLSVGSIIATYIQPDSVLIQTRILLHSHPHQLP